MDCSVKKVAAPDWQEGMEFLSLKQEAKREQKRIEFPILHQHTPDIKPSDITTHTGTGWLNELRTIVQKGVDSGLFKGHDTDELLTRVFHEVHEIGLCKTLVDCISADRNRTTPITKTVQSVLENPERSCLGQVCYSVSHDLKALTNEGRMERYFEQIEKACHRGPRYIDRQGKTTRTMLRAAISFRDAKKPKTQKGDAAFEKKFKNEKYRLAADRVKKRYLTAKEDEADTIGTSVTITSKAQYEQAMQLRDELTQLRKKIVGNSHDRKPIIVTAGSLPQRGPELDRRVASGEIPEIQIFEPGHVYSRLQQGDQEYWFDSASYGLTTDKRPKKFTTASLFSSDDTVLKLKAFVS